MNAHGVDYLVIGGWAAIAHGLPRTTLDVDLFVRPIRENVVHLIEALTEIGFGIARDLQPDEILKKHVFIFADQIRVDVFTRPRGLRSFDACWSRRHEIEFESTRIPIVGLEDLIRSKQTGRPQDEADLDSLRALNDDRAKRSNDET